MFECLSINSGPVVEGARKAAQVDQVEGLVVRPLLASIVELEEHVGEVDMHKSGIEDTDVRGDNGSFREKAAHFDSPVASAGADVEDSGLVFGQGRGGKLAVEKDEVDLMDDVQTGTFGLVVGHEVEVVAVSAAMFNGHMDILRFE